MPNQHVSEEVSTTRAITYVASSEVARYEWIAALRYSMEKQLYHRRTKRRDTPRRTISVEIDPIMSLSRLDYANIHSFQWLPEPKHIQLTYHDGLLEERITIGCFNESATKSLFDQCTTLIELFRHDGTKFGDTSYNRSSNTTQESINVITLGEDVEQSIEMTEAWVRSIFALPNSETIIKCTLGSRIDKV